VLELPGQIVIALRLTKSLKSWRQRRDCLAYFIRRALGGGSRLRHLRLDFPDISLLISERESQLTPYIEIVLDGIYDGNDAIRPRAGDTVIDVGANIGVFAIVQARRGARVICFEPHPGAFANLLQNLELNGIGSQVIPVNAAVSAHEGTASLVMESGSVSAHLGSPGDGEYVLVNTVRLDGELERLGIRTADLLKIDVEGAELDVLAGADQTLGHVRAAILEVHVGVDSNAVLAVMAAHGLHRVAGGNPPNYYFARAG
jgi:FkbM family methyltransferase